MDGIAFIVDRENKAYRLISELSSILMLTCMAALSVFSGRVFAQHQDVTFRDQIDVSITGNNAERQTLRRVLIIPLTMVLLVMVVMTVQAITTKIIS